MPPFLGIASKTAAVAGCVWCMENFEKEPVFCTVFCGVAAVIGAKVSYESAKVAYKRFKPMLTASVQIAKKGLE